MTILGIDHVELYVADLEKSAAVLCRDFGFRMPCGSAAGTGSQSVLLRQGTIRLLLTTATAPDHPAAGYVQRHGDGVASIAFRTDNVRRAFDKAVAAGARAIAAPAVTESEDGRIHQAVVSGFGDVTHRLVSRDGTGGEAGAAGDPDGELFEALDHAAICLLPGELESVVRFYWNAFGLAYTFDERIEVGGQAMTSRVVQDRTGAVTFTLLEPDPERDPGQIDQFLAAHDGAGVQHLALRTPGIVDAVRTLSGRGVEFLTAPAGYYRSLEGRLGSFDLPVGVLRDVNVLADRDQWGQLFQIFSHSTHERRTFFFELIERRGARTFGSGNIKALYEALNEEQSSGSDGQ
jgi:4-hydroxymandelate synthase